MAMINEIIAMKDEANGQIELSFEVVSAAPMMVWEPRRRERARWWFGQMRQTVDRALEWGAGRAPRAEQTYFRLPRGR